MNIITKIKTKRRRTSQAAPIILPNSPPMLVYALFVEHFTTLIEDLSFFFEIKQRLKCKTYSIDKEETSIIILKFFSYNVLSTDILVI